MSEDLTELLTRLDRLSAEFDEIKQWVRMAIQIADDDPEMSLTRSRKVLEYVVRDIFERKVKEPPGTRPLENLLQRLLKDGHLPARIDAYANTVRKLGNVGTHNFGEAITVADVYQSLSNLTPILEWYFTSESGIVEQIDSTAEGNAGTISDKSNEEQEELASQLRMRLARELKQDTPKRVANTEKSPQRTAPSSRRSMLIGAGVGATVLIVVGVVAALIASRGDTSDEESASPDAHPLEGTIDVRVWDPKNEERTGLSLFDENALPLKTNDQVRVEARLKHPAFVYILWIDSAGDVLPLYPWEPGRWDQRPANESPVDRVSLPPDDDVGWPIEGQPGMETLVMLVRKTRLPDDVPLKDLLGELPRQSAQEPGALVQFVNGDVLEELASDGTDRTLRLFDPQKIDDPVLRTQRLIKEKLSQHFAFTRAMSFANYGAE